MMVHGTTFDEKTHEQLGKQHADPLVRALTDMDLHGLAVKDSLLSSYDIAFEDIIAARYSKARILGKVLIEEGVTITSAAEGSAFIDAYPNARPADTPHGPTIREALAAVLAEKARLHDRYVPSQGWTLDDPAMRRQHGAELRKHSHELRRGGSPVETLQVAQDYTGALLN